MNLAALRVAVRRTVGLADNDEVATTAVVNEAINTANQSISTEKDWPWLYQETTGDTTDGSADITVPTELTRVIFLTVRGEDLSARGMRDLAQFRTDDAGVAITGPPRAYTMAGSVIKLTPVPETGTTYPYVLGYIGSEPVMDNDADTPLLPVPYHGWLVVRAALQLAIRANNSERIKRLQEEDVEWEKRVTDNVRRANSAPFIRRTRPSIWQDV